MKDTSIFQNENRKIKFLFISSNHCTKGFRKMFKNLVVEVAFKTKHTQKILIRYPKDRTQRCNDCNKKYYSQILDILKTKVH